MGLRDKAKGLFDEHKGQLQHGIEKAKETANKAGTSINQAATKRLPNTGAVTPVAQPDPTETPGTDDATASAGIAADEVAPSADSDLEVPSEPADGA